MEWIDTHTRELKVAEEAARETAPTSLKTSEQIMRSLMEENIYGCYKTKLFKLLVNNVFNKVGA